MRIVLSGGGTGGHVFPLVAVVREIRKSHQDAEIRFIGALPMDGAALEKENVEIKVIVAGKIPRYVTVRLFSELFKMPLSVLQAFWELYWYMPDVVFGKGGYGMVPVALIAWAFRIPVIIHESDAVAGLSTRLISRFSKKILLSFPLTVGLQKSSKLHTVGNPVRTTLMLGNRTRARERFHLALRPTVLVLGGSQGAAQLNQLFLEIAPQLTQEAEVIHQVGPRHAEEVAREVVLALEPFSGSSNFYHVVDFLDEEALADAYATATVVVSRAGAGAIFELALVGLPTIFIPLDSAAGNHQYHNAELLVRLGASRMLSGPNLTAHLLLAWIKDLLGNAQERKQLSERFRTFAKPNAAQEIAEIIVTHAR